MYPAYTLPVWLTDEQLLRDEAVLFGLSEARPDEKIATIRLAFAAQTALLTKQIEQHQEAIGHLNLLLETIDTPPTGAQSSAQKAWFSGWPVGLFLTGLLLTVVLGVGTYLGVVSLVSQPLALLLSGLTGTTACVAVLIVCLTTYRQARTNSVEARQQRADIHRQQAADRADWYQQKRTEIAQLYQAEAALNQQNAHRDLLICLFESEFDLARSIRHQVRDRFVDL